jgi:hypothetical protein
VLWGICFLDALLTDFIGLWQMPLESATQFHCTLIGCAVRGSSTDYWFPVTSTPVFIEFPEGSYLLHMRQ